MFKLITDKEKSFLITKNPKIAIYYHLPKIHKNTTHPQGRPIILGINSISSPLSKYINIFLQKYILTLDSYLKDSAALLFLLKDVIWSPTYKWASLDVSALYSNIPHALGIEAVDSFLSNEKNIPPAQQTFIKKGIHHILTHNYFSFNGKIYLQTRGTTMGMRFAPSYANLFMGNFEKHYIQNPNPWSEKIIVYKRYIDDLFFIWGGSELEFHTFKSHLV